MHYLLIRNKPVLLWFCASVVAIIVAIKTNFMALLDLNQLWIELAVYGLIGVVVFVWYTMSTRQSRANQWARDLSTMRWDDLMRILQACPVRAVRVQAMRRLVDTANPPEKRKVTNILLLLAGPGMLFPYVDGTKLDTVWAECPDGQIITYGQLQCAVVEALPDVTCPEEYAVVCRVLKRSAKKLAKHRHVAALTQAIQAVERELTSRINSSL